ncbi:MAG TPA: DNA polymerase III subunit gamma/tau [Anaerolineae bacterium]|nr:DNA polymerase III subunit gamma/tau [Anaerolineae bacterium]
MAYVSLYRKWRPQTFDSIVGQSHITQTLKNAIERGRVSHAYLFCGPRGTGKTTTARVLAKAINCIEGPTPTPCNGCNSCTSITDGSSIDVIELDAASNRRVEEIRELLERIPYSSTEGHKKVYIIDEVHMLTAESFNTLLKTLEEPPEHVIFVLATTEPHKVLPTILSRCQRFDFRRIAAPDIGARLEEVAGAEGVTIEASAVSLIAHHAQGALRDALGALEQLISYSSDTITSADVISLLGLTDSELLFTFTDILSKSDIAAGLLFIEELVEKGVDIRQFIKDLLDHLRTLFLIQHVPSTSPIGTPDELQERLSGQALTVSPQALAFFITTLSDTYNQSRWASEIRLLLEIALFKMAKADSDASIEGILHRIERLESAMLTGTIPVAPDVTPRQGRDTATPESRDERGIATPHGTEQAAMVGESIGTLANSAVDMEIIQKVWPQVLKVVKEKKPSRYNFFAAGKPCRIGDGRLIISFKKSAKGFVENPENLQLLQAAVRVVSGFDIPVTCEYADDSATVAVVDSTTAKESPLPVDDYIQLVQDTFGAKIVEEISIDEITSEEER